FDVVDRGGRTAPWRSKRLAAIPIGANSGRGCSRRRTVHNLHVKEIAHSIFLEALHHLFEHVERFSLVLHQGITLGISAQSDTFLQVVHAEEMVFPLSI